jgi:HPt (histidine-containing phosphotransfer) domain-containing protein
MSIDMVPTYERPSYTDSSKGAARAPVVAWLDLEHLRRYTLDDTTLQSELLALFRVHARVQLDLLFIATLPTDFRHAVHALKGAALGIGANAIAATSRQLESVGFSGEPRLRRQLMQRLAEEIEASDAEIARITG